MFPMEIISDGILQGSEPGIITGRAGLVNGRHGKALYTNGNDQWVNFGNQRNTCFGNLNACYHGFVMAMWLKVYRHKGSDEYYLCSGGHTVSSMGIAVLMQNSKLLVSARTDSRSWVPQHVDFEILTWYHVTLTWTVSNGLQLYLNALLVAGETTGAYVENNQGNWPDFILGTLNTDNRKLFAGEMSMDELRIWDAVMESSEIMDIYVSDVISLTVAWTRLGAIYRWHEFVLWQSDDEVALGQLMDYFRWAITHGLSNVNHHFRHRIASSGHSEVRKT